jgi:hypothetical protein
VSLSSHKISTVILLIMAVLLIGNACAAPVFASFCHISNISYNYPQQITPGQSFLTTTTVSGVCASDDSYFYLIRVDLNDVSGQVLSYSSVPMGYGGQNRQVIVQNLVAAPMNVGPWQIQFIVYVFAHIAAGGIMDSRTTHPVTIQVGTPQTTQTIPSVTIVSQTTVPTFTVISRTSTSPTSTQTVSAGSSSEKIYPSIVAILGILTLVTLVVLIKQRQVKQVKRERTRAKS